MSEERIISLNRVEEKGTKKDFEFKNLGVLSSDEVKKFTELEREMYIRDF